VAVVAATLAMAVGTSRTARAGSSLEPYVTVSADGRYDDYIPGGGEGFIARIAPGAGGRIHTTRLVLRVDWRSAYDRYERTQVEVPDSWNHHGKLALDYALSRRWRLRVTGQADYARDPREIDRIGVVTPPGVRIFDTTNDARATWNATRKLSVEGGYGFRYTSFGDEPTPMGPIAIPGGSEHDLTLRGLFHVERAGSAIAGYRGQIFVIGSGAQTHSPTVGYTRHLTELLTAEVEGGPMLYVQGAGGTLAPTMPGALDV
jgi:hypothetical protein